MSPWISHRFLRAQSDERLLGAAARGHGRAFEMLVERHRPALLAHARYLLDATGAEDALQQGLLNAWIALQRGDQVRNPRAWLFRVVHNTSVDLLRGARPQPGELTESLGAARAVEADTELRQAVRDTLASVAALPAAQREALLRTALDGDSHERVGSALGVSAAAVRGLVYRARSSVRAAAGALLPPPLIVWGAAAQRRLLSLRLGAPGPGASQALLERGAAVLSAGALVAGVAVARQQTAGHARHTSRAAAMTAKASHSVLAGPVTATSAHAGSTAEGARAGGAHALSRLAARRPSGRRSSGGAIQQRVSGSRRGGEDRGSHSREGGSEGSNSHGDSGAEQGSPAGSDGGSGTDGVPGGSGPLVSGGDGSSSDGSGSSQGLQSGEGAGAADGGSGGSGSGAESKSGDGSGGGEPSAQTAGSSSGDSRGSGDATEAGT